MMRLGSLVSICVSLPNTNTTTTYSCCSAHLLKTVAARVQRDTLNNVSNRHQNGLGSGIAPCRSKRYRDRSPHNRDTANSRLSALVERYNDLVTESTDR